MADGRTTLSAYRLMWMLVMFDLPVGTKAERKAAAEFRFQLLDYGFEMAQYSVYMRFCVSQHQAETMSTRIASALPEDGKVSILLFTDKQYERILSFCGRAQQPGKEPPPQFYLF